MAAQKKELQVLLNVLGKTKGIKGIIQTLKALSKSADTLSRQFENLSKSTNTNFKQIDNAANKTARTTFNVGKAATAGFKQLMTSASQASKATFHVGEAGSKGFRQLMASASNTTMSYQTLVSSAARFGMVASNTAPSKAMGLLNQNLKAVNLQVQKTAQGVQVMDLLSRSTANTSQTMTLLAASASGAGKVIANLPLEVRAQGFNVLRATADKLNITMQRLTSAMVQTGIGIRQTGKNTVGFFKQATGEAVKFKKVIGQLRTATQRFSFEWLGVLFISMAAQRAIFGFLRSAVNVYERVTKKQGKFTTQTNRVAAAWRFFKFQLISALAETGVFKTFIDLVSGLLRWMNKLSPSTLAWIAVIVILAGVLAKILFIGSQLALGLKSMWMAGKKVAGWFKKIFTRSKDLSEVLDDIKSKKVEDLNDAVDKMNPIKVGNLAKSFGELEKPLDDLEEHKDVLRLLRDIEDKDIDIDIDDDDDAGDYFDTIDKRSKKSSGRIGGFFKKVGGFLKRNIGWLADVGVGLYVHFKTKGSKGIIDGIKSGLSTAATSLSAWWATIPLGGLPLPLMPAPGEIDAPSWATFKDETEAETAGFWGPLAKLWMDEAQTEIDNYDLKYNKTVSVPFELNTTKLDENLGAVDTKINETAGNATKLEIPSQVSTSIDETRKAAEKAASGGFFGDLWQGIKDFTIAGWAADIMLTGKSLVPDLTAMNKEFKSSLPLVSNSAFAMGRFSQNVAGANTALKILNEEATGLETSGNKIDTFAGKIENAFAPALEAVSLAMLGEEGFIFATHAAKIKLDDLNKSTDKVIIMVGDFNKIIKNTAEQKLPLLSKKLKTNTDRLYDNADAHWEAADAANDYAAALRAVNRAEAGAT